LLLEVVLVAAAVAEVVLAVIEQEQVLPLQQAILLRLQWEQVVLEAHQGLVNLVTIRQ